MSISTGAPKKRMPAEGTASRRRWVRKNIRVDQRKLDAARRALGVRTETETVDAALDAVTLRRELMYGVRRIRDAGGIIDIYAGR
ncbi:MAG: hypothetical protein GEU99_19305 [Luteitalea sp.]|nr:hypothetical protein [Luteitalea sp.]